MLALSDLMFEPKNELSVTGNLHTWCLYCRYVHNNCINSTASALCLCMFGYLLCPTQRMIFDICLGFLLFCCPTAESLCFFS